MIDGLKDYQVPSVVAGMSILQRHRAFLDASDTGIGKTYVAMGVAREFGIKPVVVCPKSVKTAWHKVAAHLGGECFTVNYESLKGDLTEWGVMHRPEGFEQARELVKLSVQAVKDAGMEVNPSMIAHMEKMRKIFKQLKAQVRYEWAAGIPLLVFDEVQRCKDPDSLNSKMLIAAKRQGIPVIMSSATPAQSPLDMKGLGFALGLHRGVNFWDWCRKNGCKPSRFGGLEFVGGPKQLRLIHAQIFPERGIRVTRESLGAAFPETQITAELYDLNSGAGKIDALYAEMEKSLTALRLKAAGDADLEHPLTQLLRARQEVELIKVPVFVDLIEQHLEQGMSVAVFVNFTETLNAIADRFVTNTPYGIIAGGDRESEREDAITCFQSGKIRLVLCNIKAGGVGISLHDETGLHPRVALISPTYSAQDLVQALGRVHRQNGSKSLQRIVLAAGTVEEKIHRKLTQKLHNISLITDGDLSNLL